MDHNDTKPASAPTPLEPIYLRARDICGHDGLLRISRSKFFAMVAAGDLPKPLKCGRVSLWRRDGLLLAFRGVAR